MILTTKSYNDKNKLEALTMVIKNDNRKTIELFDATSILEAVNHDYDTVIELLKQSKCTPLTQIESKAVDLYGKPHGEPFDITPEEFDYAVKNGLTIRQLDELKNVWRSIEGYEVKV